MVSPIPGVFRSSDSVVPASDCTLNRFRWNLGYRPIAFVIRIEGQRFPVVCDRELNHLDLFVLVRIGPHEVVEIHLL